ncbi:sodium/hydrogen exchanger 3 isoform X3 [Diabrotica virgifera virgifera]|uniref:Sodium/hydrogen exchanger n=2 Tax=Diabrotica virgifera virgifera TaxID=50390 RepID=A0ABM5JNT0_DIAVI|nr:sodium/hydrogen exchanger 3 isoform X3 [Diabrotica virgifera virgifera]
MYSLEHGVNLSRRACKTGYVLLTVLLLLLLIGNRHCFAKPPNHAADNHKQPSANLDTNSYDFSSLYKAIPTPSGHRTNLVPVEDVKDNTQEEVITGLVTQKTPDKKEVTRYPIISVSFHRVETPFIIALWIFCASLSKIGFHMAPKLSEIFPESCLLIFVGVVIGVILVHITDSVHMSPLTPDTFFFYMLPPIILDAGYFMPNRLFFEHFGTILLFAVVGTIFNTLTIGASLWAVGLTGLFSCDTPLLDMFLFGSLISAVDPVAVLAVFEEIQVNEILYIVVFGESLLNDAVTVVLYHLFESYTEMGLKNILYVDMISGFLNFWVVAIGGTVIGVIWGIATSIVTKFTNEVRVIEPIFIFVMAYLAYLNAEIFHMSGILAITFCGITMKNYVEANISHKSHTTIKYTMKMLSSSSETIIFMFLGVATVNKNHDWNTWFVILTIVFCSFYRVIGVIIFTALANRFRLNQLSTVDKFVMSYGGLRGAVAFALVLLIDPRTVKLQPMFMTTTIAVVYFTVFFQGITIKPLVKILNVKTAEKKKPTMNERIHERLMDHAMAGIEDILGQHGNYHIRDRFKRFDNHFIRPYVLRNHQGAEQKILETYSKLAMRDAMEYMRRNASTIGNISGTESMSAIFKNYTAGNINSRSGTDSDEPLRESTSFSQLDSSTWNIDMQELEYNPSKKDLTDAKIHHLLAEELGKPYRRHSRRGNLITHSRRGNLLTHRKLSYSRHAVNDRDLSTQVNYRMHFNMRRLVADKKHHHKRHSKKLNKDGKQNHVSFPEFQQNGTAKQFCSDYITEVLNEDETEPSSKTTKEDWDSPITFTAKSSHESVCSDSAKRSSKGSIDVGDFMRVSTPTATEMMLPWKREEEGCVPILQSEFPGWASNKEYLAYNSPSATFLGGLENPRSSVIGLFRRESIGSEQSCSAESTPQKERRNSSGRSTSLLVDDSEKESDPLGVLQKPLMPISPLPQPPGQRRQARRGSMMELNSGSITRDIIPEEAFGTSSLRRPSWVNSNTAQRRSSFTRQPTTTLGASLMTTVSSPSPTPSDESTDDADIDCLMKAGF